MMFSHLEALRTVGLTVLLSLLNGINVINVIGILAESIIHMGGFEIM